MESNTFCGIERDENIKILASDEGRPGALRACINAKQLLSHSSRLHVIRRVRSIASSMKRKLLPDCLSSRWQKTTQTSFLSKFEAQRAAYRAVAYIVCGDRLFT